MKIATIKKYTNTSSVTEMKVFVNKIKEILK